MASGPDKETLPHKKTFLDKRNPQQEQDCCIWLCVTCTAQKQQVEGVDRVEWGPPSPLTAWQGQWGIGQLKKGAFF